MNDEHCDDFDDNDIVFVVDSLARGLLLYGERNVRILFFFQTVWIYVCAGAKYRVYQNRNSNYKYWIGCVWNWNVSLAANGILCVRGCVSASARHVRIVLYKWTEYEYLIWNVMRCIFRMLTHYYYNFIHIPSLASVSWVRHLVFLVRTHTHTHCISGLTSARVVI